MRVRVFQTLLSWFLMSLSEMNLLHRVTCFSASNSAIGHFCMKLFTNLFLYGRMFSLNARSWKREGAKVAVHRKSNVKY